MPLFLRVLRRGLVLLILMAVATGCGSDDASPGPTGAPATVVADAPERTLAAGSAQVSGAAPGVSAEGLVNFATGADSLDPAGINRDNPPFGVLQPVAMIDLLRGVVEVEPYGGAEVQGIGTKRYQVDIDLAKAITATPASRRAELERLDGRVGDDGRLWADVFVDDAGRVRRMLIPVAIADERPYGDSKAIPYMVSVDYSDFGGGQ